MSRLGSLAPLGGSRASASSTSNDPHPGGLSSLGGLAPIGRSAPPSSASAASSSPSLGPLAPLGGGSKPTSTTSTASYSYGSGSMSKDTKKDPSKSRKYDDGGEDLDDLSTGSRKKKGKTVYTNVSREQ